MSEHIQSNRKVGLSPFAYRGAPTRLGSSWTLIEKSPPDPDGWKDFNRKRAWNWQPISRRHATRRKSSFVDKALAMLLANAEGRKVGR